MWRSDESGKRRAAAFIHWDIHSEYVVYIRWWKKGPSNNLLLRSCRSGKNGCTNRKEDCWLNLFFACHVFNGQKEILRQTHPTILYWKGKKKVGRTFSSFADLSRSILQAFLLLVTSFITNVTDLLLVPKEERKKKKDQLLFSPPAIVRGKMRTIDKVYY